MTNPTLLEMSRKVYEAMADKSLSKGCMIGTDYAEDQELYGYTYMGFNEHKEEHHIYFNRSLDQISNIKGELNGKGLIGQIIGHPLHIGYVLDWIEKNKSIVYKHHTIPSLTIISSRPKDHLSQPIPLDPDESRRPLLEFLVGLID